MRKGTDRAALVSTWIPGQPTTDEQRVKTLVTVFKYIERFLRE